MNALGTTLAAVTAIAHKDLRLLGRDPMALFWVLVFPLLFSSFIGAVLRAGVDHELTPMQVAWVDDSAGRVEGLRQSLQKAGLDLRPASLELATQRVRTAKAVALIHVPADFGDGRAAIELGRDPARPTEANLVEQWLRVGLRAPQEQGAPSVRVSDAVSRPNSSAGLSLVLPAMILWALLGCSATFAVSLVSERSAGTLLRLRAAPVPRASILAGKALACFAACMLAAGLLTVVACAGLGVQLTAPWKWLVALLAVASCFTGITVLLSVLGKSEQSVAGAGWAVLIVLAMLGGAMVPLTFLPDWLHRASQLSPVRWSMLALEGALLRAFSLRELAPTLLLLLGIGVGSFGLGSLVLARQEGS